MQKIILLVSLFFGLCSLSAQSLITPLGGYTQNSSGDLSFSVGEVAIATQSNTSHILTQGFHQNDGKAISISESDLYKDLSLYPNPFTDELSLIGNGVRDIKKISVVSTSGQLVFQQSKSYEGESLNLASLPKGVYFFNIYSDSGLEKVFQIIKQ